MNAHKSLSERLPALAELAQGRDHITTSELAGLVCLKAASVRKVYQTTGTFCGVRPVILGRALLWPAVDVARILGSTNQEQQQ